MTRKAFTLIELLVVIAIIAILAAILFPVFAQAREKARQISCLSNMKQIGNAITMYYQDFDEVLPPRCHWAAPNVFYEGLSWRRILLPYVKNLQVYTCPSNPSNKTLARDSSDAELTRAGLSLTSSPRFNISYGVNGQDNLPTPMRRGDQVIQLATLNRPAELILIAEHTRDNSEFNLSRLANTSSNGMLVLFSKHSSMANYIFADGHAKAMKPTATCGAGNSNNMWYNDMVATPCPSTPIDIIGMLRTVEAFYR